MLLMDTYPSLPWHPNHGFCNVKRIEILWTSCSWQIWKQISHLQLFINHLTGKRFTGHMQIGHLPIIDLFIQETRFQIRSLFGEELEQKDIMIKVSLGLHEESEELVFI